MTTKLDAVGFGAVRKTVFFFFVFFVFFIFFCLPFPLFDDIEEEEEEEEEAEKPSTFCITRAPNLLGEIGCGPGTTTCVLLSIPIIFRLIKNIFNFLFSHRKPPTTMEISCLPTGTSRKYFNPFFSSECTTNTKLAPT